METIAVISNSKHPRKMLAEQLCGAGYRVVLTENSAEGLAIAKAEWPDLVIVDLVMPSMESLEFVRQLRTDPDTAQTAVAFYSEGYHEPEILSLAKACGVSHILFDGCPPEDLLRKVSAALRDTLPYSQATPRGENFVHAHRQKLTDKLARKVAELEAANVALIQKNCELQREATERKRDQDKKEILDKAVGEQQQQRLIDLVASVPGVVWEARFAPDTTNQLVDFVSNHIEEMTGFSCAEWLSTPNFWLTLVHPEDKERAAKEAAAIFAGKKRGESTFRWIRRDGRTIWVKSRFVVILNDTGVPVGMRGVTVDITAQKEAEKLRFEAHEALELRVTERTAELAEANRRLEAEIAEHERTEEELRKRKESFKALSANSPDFISRINRELRFLYTNRKADRFVGKTLGESASAEFADLWKKQILEVFATRRPGEMNFEVPDERNERRFFQSRLVPEFTIDGEVVSVLIVSRDITELKRAAQELQLQKTLLEAQGETSLDGILVVNSERHIISFNRRLVEMWQAPQEVITLRSADAALQYAEGQVVDPGAFRAKVIYLQENRDESSRDEVRLKDGRIFDRYSTPLKGLDGQYHGRIWFYRDVTEQERAEEAIRQAKTEAERANRAKSEFLSRMSHELRTPLNAILGFAQLIELEGLYGEQRESIDQILRGGRHLLDLINEVLDIARIESGRLSISPEPVRVTEVLEECVQLIRPIAAQRNIRIDSNHSLDCELHVLADRQRFKQVLLNLVSNAVKYNHDAGVVFLSCESKSDKKMRVMVADTGYGIAPSDLHRLFEPFERLSADQSQIEGSGLGLTISKRLIELMGGVVGVESTVGKGSVFWVEMPLVDSPMDRVDKGDQFLASSGGGISPVPQSTVLYIEDNLSNLRLIERVFTKRPNVKLITAMQGSLGVELAQKHHPDLILLDLNLPDMSGHQILQRLHGDPLTGNTPVVMISADATPGTIERLLKAGAHAYLSKPLDVREFLGVVDKALATNFDEAALR